MNPEPRHRRSSGVPSRDPSRLASASTRPRRWAPAILRATPLAVWLAAVGVAWWYYPRLSAGGGLDGVAEERSLTLTHLEPAIVRGVYVQLHERVEAGQLLVSMNDEEQRNALAAVQKDFERLLSEVTAEATRLTADNERKLERAEDLARRFMVDRESAHIEYLSHQVQDAIDRAMLQGQSIEYDIVRDLRRRDSATFRENNEIETTTAALKAKVESNQDALQRQRGAFEAAEQRWTEFVEREPSAISADPILTPLRLAAEVRERELQELVRQIDAQVLRSPIDGQVTEVFAQPGDRLTAGAPVLALAPTEANRVIVYLPEQRFGATQIGASASIVRRLAGEGSHRYRGRVVSLSAVVGEAPLRFRRIPNLPVWGRAVVVALEDDVRLLPGEGVRVHLQPN